MKDKIIEKMAQQIIDKIQRGDLTEEKCVKMFRPFKPSWIKDNDFPAYVHEKYQLIKEGKITAQDVASKYRTHKNKVERSDF